MHPNSKTRQKKKTLDDNFKAGADANAGLSGRRPVYSDERQFDNAHTIDRAGQHDHDHEYREWLDETVPEGNR